MKPTYALAAIAVASALVIGSVAPAASADTAPAPLTLIGPTQGQTLKTTHPAFSWVAPAGETNVEVVVSSASTTRADGLLPTTGKNYVSSSQADDGATSYIDKDYDYPPAAYYWQVNAYDAAGVRYASKVQKFVVPVFFDLKKAKTKISHMAYNGQRAIFGNATMYCNYAQDQYYTEFRMDVYKGKKKLASSSQARGDCVGMFGVKSEAVWAPPASLKSGTKLTIKLYGISTHNSTVRWGGSKIAKKKGPATVLTLTWRK